MLVLCGDFMSIQKKLNSYYYHIKENHYLCTDDSSIGTKRFNSALFLGIATTINCGRELIYGEYGLGKTTSCENIISAVYGFPKELVQICTLKGNPEQTEEKIVARPNLGELNKGIEKVIWSNFVLLGPKLIDEINRLPASKQNVILEGTDRGKWKYLNDSMDKLTSGMFCTANYSDDGNYELIPPLVDRIEIAVESKHPGINNLRLKRSGGLVDIFSDREITNKMLEIYSKEQNIEDIESKIKTLRNEYRERVNDKISSHNKTNPDNPITLELLSDQELLQAKKEIDGMELSYDAWLFYDVLTTELSSCQMFGQKRSNEQCIQGCKYSDYLCNKVSNCLSIRSDNAIKKYAATVAWLLGKNEVDVEHIAYVLPYAIWHKTKFKKDYLDGFKDSVRNDPLQLFATKESVEGIKRRFSETKKSQKLMIQKTIDGDLNGAKEIAEKNEHPVFRGYRTI